MLKFFKKCWPWKSKSMTATEIITSWAKFSNEDEKLAERERIFQEGIKRKSALKKATTRSKTMPLVKSAKPAAFKKNIATSVKEGKPVKQAVAIAYSEKRAATKKTTKKDKK